MAKPKSSALNTRNWRGAIFRDPVPDAMELARKVAGVELTEADRALLQQAQEQARARMSRRTIDETGKDTIERRPEPELIQPGWYWTGDETMWVIGTTSTQQTVYYQRRCSTGGVLAWELSNRVAHWRRVHDAVQESGQGFGWRPDR